MREHDGIEPPNIFAQRLCPKISAGIDNERALRRFNVDRRSQPLIARIGRTADVAIATDHRHALRCARAEKSKDQARLEI